MRNAESSCPMGRVPGWTRRWFGGRGNMRNVHHGTAAVSAARRLRWLLLSDANGKVLKQIHVADDVIVLKQSMAMLGMVEHQIGGGRCRWRAELITHGHIATTHNTRSTAAYRTRPFGRRHHSKWGVRVRQFVWIWLRAWLSGGWFRREGCLSTTCDPMIHTDCIGLIGLQEERKTMVIMLRITNYKT